jgi:Ran GTPase-activating protein 1
MLAECLTKCYEAGSKVNTPLKLKVFVSGRGRLENEGSKALAKVFEVRYRP